LEDSALVNPSNPYKFQFMEEMECHYESSIT